MATYGVVSYDIAKVYDPADGSEVPRSAQTKVPGGLLKLGWLRASKSTYTGDLSRRDEVMDLLRRELDHPKDVIFPVIRIEKESEREIKEWVRTSTRQFFEEVVSGIRARADALMGLLEKDKLGIGDVGEKLDERIAKTKKKIEDIMVALATFRLSDEFKDFRDACLKDIETVQDRTLVRLTEAALKVQEAKEATKRKDVA